MFIQYLILHAKRIAKPALGVLAMATAALVLSGIATVAALQIFSSSSQTNRMSFAVVEEDEGGQVTTLLRLATSMNQFRGISVVSFDTYDDAVNAVKNGEATAALIFPIGFWRSLMNGENMEPTLVVNSERPIEMMLVSSLGQSAVQLLTTAQNGTTMGVYLLDAAGVSENNQQSQINRMGQQYILWVLGQESFFTTSTLQTTGLLPVTHHYILSLLLFLTLLTSTLLHRFFSLNGQKGWIKRLQASGLSLLPYSAVQILLGTFLFSVFLLVLSFVSASVINFNGWRGINMGNFIPALLLCALFTSCFGYLLCNSGSILAAIGLNFLLSASLLFVGGGLFPPALLPASLRQIAPYTPIWWMRSTLASIFNTTVDATSFAFLFFTSVVLLALCFIQTLVFTRRLKA